MKALSIGWINVKRMLRDRSNIFFVFIFPIALVLLIGIQFGGSFAPSVAVHRADDGSLSEAILDRLESEESLEVRVVDTPDAAVRAVETGSAQAGVLIPADLDEVAPGDERIEIGYIARPDGAGVQIQSVIDAAIAEVMTPVGAARFAAAETDSPFDEALSTARDLVGVSSPIEVETVTTGEATFPGTLGQFDLGASSQLVLFTFLTGVAGSSALILTRQLGISQRMLSTPTPLSTIVIGESLGRFGTAIVQGLYIVVLTLIIFSVNWGDPLGALLILVALSAVGAGAGMLMGATFQNDQQAAGIGVMVSLGLAALGGAMFPLDLFPPTMQRIAHITPHAWALDGFAELVRRGGDTFDILPELGVLALYALVLLALASWRLRVAITRP